MRLMLVALMLEACVCLPVWAQDGQHFEAYRRKYVATMVREANRGSADAQWPCSSPRTDSRC
jgi:hypothetical protein